MATAYKTAETVDPAPRTYRCGRHVRPVQDRCRVTHTQTGADAAPYVVLGGPERCCWVTVTLRRNAQQFRVAGKATLQHVTVPK